MYNLAQNDTNTLKSCNCTNYYFVDRISIILIIFVMIICTLYITISTNTTVDYVTLYIT